MKVSPCGWFCFEEPEGWKVVETTDTILLSHIHTGAVVEINSLRKEHIVRESEVWRLLEHTMPQTDHAEFEETTQFRLPSGLPCLKCVLMEEHRLLGKAYIFWGPYLTHMSLTAEIAPAVADACLQDFHRLLESVQALTIK